MIRSLAADFLAVLRDGIRIWWLAPLIPLLMVVPEAIQHIAEIRIGMFDSIEAARALADDPRRMVWGYVKVAGLMLAILAAIRFWNARARGKQWWDLRDIAWRAVGVSVLAIIVTSVPEWLLEGQVAPAVSNAVTLVITLATLPVLVLLVAGLAGDRTATLAGLFCSGWLAAARIALFFVLCWLPLSYLHTANHRWAMGAAQPLVWALMAVDFLVVGLMAVMAGTAIHHGYSSPTANAEEPNSLVHAA